MPQEASKIRGDKKTDLRRIEKSKKKIEHIITKNEIYPPNVKGPKITKLISKLLEEAQAAKSNYEGAVSIDRKLKLVDWACHRAFPYFDTVYRLRLNELPESPERNAAVSHINVICADICRYMSVTASIPRTERELNLEERFKRDFWARKAMAYYDSSDIPISSYDVRIRRLLYDTPLSLVVALLFSLRNLSRYSSSIKPSVAAQSVGRTTNVERAISNLKESPNAGKLFWGVAVCTEEVVNLVKHKDAGWPLKNMITLDKLLDKVRRDWNKPEPEKIERDDADAVIFALVMLADLFKYGLQEPPRVLMSGLMKTNPLRNRVQEFINPEHPLQFSSQLLRYFFETTTMNGDSFRTKIQRLNSRPADF